MTPKEKFEKARALYAEAKQLLAEGADSQAVERAQKLMEEADGMKEAATREMQLLEKSQTALTELEQAAEESDQPVSSGSFKSMNEFLQTVWWAMNPQNRKGPDPRLQYFRKDKDEDEATDRATKAAPMVESVGASGGFLVPTEFRAQLMSVSGEDAIVRPRASIIRMTRRQVQLPVVDQTAVTAGVPHWFGGMQFYWSEEAAEKTATDAKFRQVVLTANKLIGYTYASDELVDDAALSLGDFLTGPLGFAGGALWMEDYAFLRGTGAGQPLGVINAGATISVPRAQAGPPTYVSFGDVVDMRTQFMPSGRGVWVINQGLMSNIIQMSAPSSNPSLVMIGGGVEGIPTQMLGFPIIWTEKLPAAGSAGDILLADFNYYLLGDRQATTIESTQYDQWKYDRTSWRMVHRVDGRPWLSSPLTLADGATQISPFVILGAKTT